MVASNAAGSVSSLATALTVWMPPTITAQPQSLTNIAGTAATFSASVSGTEPLSYQWQFNGSNIVGATGTTLALNNVQPTDAGNYTLMATNIAGAVTSAVAALTVWVQIGRAHV